MKLTQKFLLFIFFLLFSPSAIFSTINPPKVDENFKKSENTIEKVMEMAGKLQLLLGSSPPKCVGKCKTCTPCKPVLVRVPPGKPVQFEVSRIDYYPQIWRCQCGGNLYKPS
ncbi:EPIDERMAL PATTERNING FACTOR-like protein 6 [Abeliophyllum distichum]|uniref:Epidermal patterning factor-like protein n=1 Tax=Abeliophyllum distichum TaxID=126358 RepID=A0ABD1PT87_9LAMI